MRENALFVLLVGYVGERTEGGNLRNVIVRSKQGGKGGRGPGVREGQGVNRIGIIK